MAAIMMVDYDPQRRVCIATEMQTFPAFATQVTVANPGSAVSRGVACSSWNTFFDIIHQCLHFLLKNKVISTLPAESGRFGASTEC
jgi:hypothetical protein